MLESVRQAAVIPIYDGQIYLISSRNKNRWIIPKGTIEYRHTAGETALREAWEEAGLTGSLIGEPLGSYVYQKEGKDHHVIVFVMEVHKIHEAYPESYLRKRICCNLLDALERLDDQRIKSWIETALSNRCLQGLSE